MHGGNLHATALQQSMAPPHSLNLVRVQERLSFPSDPARPSLTDRGGRFSVSGAGTRLRSCHGAPSSSPTPWQPWILFSFLLSFRAWFRSCLCCVRSCPFVWHYGARLHHFKLNFSFSPDKSNLFSPENVHFCSEYGWNRQIWMKKCMNMIEKCFMVHKMDGWRNIKLHQISSDRHFGTFSKTKKKGLS